VLWYELTMSHYSTDRIRCAACGGHNRPGTTLCEFCARSLQRVSAARVARPHQFLTTAWVVPMLVALVLLSMLIVRLVAAAS
jgi:hypothetical protein